MPVGRRKVRDRNDAERLVRELDASDQTLRAFCDEHHVDARSLHCWEMNLSRASRPKAAASPLRFVELVAQTAPVTPCRYLVHVGDVAIEVGDAFSEDSLARLLALVRAC